MPPLKTIAVRVQSSALLAPLALSVALCLSNGCGNHTPTEPSYSNIAGTYSVAFSDSCGNAGTDLWTLIQDGRTFHTPAGGDRGAVSGSISGDTATIMITSGLINCQYSLTGTAHVQNATLTGSASGMASGPEGCCTPLMTYRFSAARQP